MEHDETESTKKLNKIQLYIYLTPGIGFFASLWTLYLHQGNKQQQQTSRLVVTFTLMWLCTYILIGFGATQTSELLTLRLLFMNSLLTSGYFLLCIGLMIQVWRGKTPRLPGLSSIAEGFVRKKLS